MRVRLTTTYIMHRRLGLITICLIHDMIAVAAIIAVLFPKLINQEPQSILIRLPLILIVGLETSDRSPVS